MTRRGAGAGRAVLVVGLVGFVVVASAVIWRRTLGVTAMRDLRELERERTTLRAEQARLESEVRAAASRARLAPVVERRLGMRIPADSQVIILPRRVEARP